MNGFVDLAALASALAPHLERLGFVVRDAATEGVEATYSSLSLPPDIKNRTTFAKLAKKCPGARKIGQSWVVSCAAWATYRSAPPRRSKSTTTNTTSDLETEADIAARSGLRLAVSR